MSNNLSRRKVVKAGAVAALGALPFGRSLAKQKYDAIIVGAGLSGLYSAMILEEMGLNVLTLEGRDRVGGRVYTLMGVPGKPEAAGELIGANYARMIRTANDLGLELFKPDMRLGAGERFYYIKGQRILASEWEGHELNPLSGDDRAILPEQMLSVLSNRNNPLSGRGLDEWIKPEFHKYDIPHDEYLRTHLGLNEETIRLMNVTIHTDRISNTSALHELRRYAVGEFNQQMASIQKDVPAYQQVKGGNSLLTKAMAESLENGVLLNKTVYGFDDTGSSVTVHCSDGTSYTANQVISTMPISLLKNVKFNPRPPEHMQTAFLCIDYGLSIQVHYLVTRDFWEEDGLPKNIWSDAPIERFAVIQRPGSPATAIAFINGIESMKYNFMSDEDVIRHVALELEKVRPSTKGALKALAVQSCHRDLHGAGDWVFWRPGQIKKYGSKLHERHGNIHFAGEHTAVMERGMEAAFESGERAALELVSRA